ncbi:hypothetical protein EC988_002887 [Linderina pennispora]|nr:hypothetical protein EC988_002887 [Linderina pennispora]
MSNSRINIRILTNTFSPSGPASLDSFKIFTEPAPTKDSLKENQVLICTLYLSIDPYQRGRLTGAINSYVPRYEINEPIKGDIVSTLDANWESFSVVNTTTARKVPTDSSTDARDAVTIFSLLSFTAYTGLMGVGKPKAGGTILASSVSGTVGQIVVQLGKARSLRVIGVAGSDDKVECVKSLGADAAFNYKTCGNFVEAIKRVTPEGVDIYYDNVGGEFLDAALTSINASARVVVCGMISQYNVKSTDDAYGLKNSIKTLNKAATMQGFLAGSFFGTSTEAAFMNEVGRLYKENKLKYRSHGTLGLENASQALLDLFEGKNNGRSYVRI